jgi:hypothetical protein
VPAATGSFGIASGLQGGGTTPLTSGLGVEPGSLSSPNASARIAGSGNPSGGTA